MSGIKMRDIMDRVSKAVTGPKSLVAVIPKDHSTSLKQALKTAVSDVDSLIGRKISSPRPCGNGELCKVSYSDLSSSEVEKVKEYLSGRIPRVSFRSS